MKKLSFIIATLIVCLVAVCQNPSYGQVSKEEKKMGKYIEQKRDDARSEVNRKPSKVARKEEKTLMKEGFRPLDGTSIAYMVDEVLIHTAQRKSDGKRQYIKGTGMSTKKTLENAEAESQNAAMLAIAKNLNRIILDHAKKEFGTDEMAEVYRTLEKADLVTTQELAFADPLLEVYKYENGQYTVKITIAYDLDNIMEGINRKMKKTIEQDLKDRLDDFTPFYEKIDVICDGVQCRIAE